MVAVTSISDDMSRERRRKVVEAAAWASENWRTVGELVASSDDAGAAAAVLSERYGFDAMQADVCLSVSFRRLTKSDRAAYKKELEELDRLGQTGQPRE